MAGHFLFTSSCLGVPRVKRKDSQSWTAPLYPAKWASSVGVEHDTCAFMRRPLGMTRRLLQAGL